MTTEPSGLDRDRVALYRALGVPPGSIPARYAGAIVPPAPASPFDLEALDLAGLEALERLLDQQPELVLQGARTVLDADLTEADLREAIRRAKEMLRAPREALALLEAQRALARAAHRLPDGFTFPGMDLDEIDIDPGDTKFEKWRDAVGWLINTGRTLFNRPPGSAPVGDRGKFRFHEGFSSGFVYPLHGGADAPLDVALLSDFGTGLYHSRYIAKQLETRRFPYAIHLGDVYYAGREPEVADYFKAPLAPILDTTRVFSMNSNHEMFSKGEPYLQYITERKERAPDLQEQEGSYFCLRGAKAQIIGLDTDYFGQFRCTERAILDWLGEQLAHGRRHGLTNVLLTGDEPYTDESPRWTPLLEDLREFVLDDDLVDLWFWGNTHYCALFAPNPAVGLRFIGSCIGHGGYPYKRRNKGTKGPATVLFFENTPRFPEGVDLPHDRGNNGYCILSLLPSGDIRLRYVDWMAQDRHTALLRRGAGGRLSLS